LFQLHQNPPFFPASRSSTGFFKGLPPKQISRIDWKLSYMFNKPGFFIAKTICQIAWLLAPELAAQTTAPRYELIRPSMGAFQGGPQINDKGQVIASHVVGGNTQFWIYLPAPDYGLPSGVRLLTQVAGLSATITDLNEEGVFLFTGGYGRINGATVNLIGNQLQAVNNSGIAYGTDGPSQNLIEYDTVAGGLLRTQTLATPLPNSGWSQFWITLRDVSESGLFLGRAGGNLSTWSPGGTPSRPILMQMGGGPMTFPGLYDGVAAISPSPIYSIPTEAFLLRVADTINSKGQVVGYEQLCDGECEVGMFGVPLSKKVQTWIYLPEADYGYPAGLNYLPESESFPSGPTNFVGISENGDLWKLQDNWIWHRGSVIRYHEHLLVPRQVQVLRTWDINAGGQILATVVLDGGANSELVIFSPSMAADAVATPDRVRVGEEIALDVIIGNRTNRSFATTGVLGGTLAVVGNGQVSQLTNPPALPQLAAGATGVQTFAFRADQLGGIRFSVQPIGFLPGGGNITINTVLSNEVRIFEQGDLMIKRAAEPDERYGGNDEYQTAPRGQQRETIGVAEGNDATFLIRIQNDESHETSFVLNAQEDPDDEWTTDYLVGGISVKAALLSETGYTTPDLAPGAIIELTAVFTPLTAEVGDSKDVLFRLLDEGGTLVDTLDAIAQRVAVEIEVNLRGTDAASLDADSIEEGRDDIDAPLVPATSFSALENSFDLQYGLVADGVTPMLFRLEIDPDALAQMSGPYPIDLEANIESGGGLATGSLSSRLRILKDGAWVDARRIEFEAAEPVRYAALVPIPSDDLNLLAASGELACTLVVRDATTSRELTTEPFYLRKPPIVLVHGYNTNGSWGSEFQAVLGKSRRTEDKRPFVLTARYGQDVLSNSVQNQLNPAYVNTVYRVDALVPLADQAIRAEVDTLRYYWAVTRPDIVAHSQGGVLARLLSSEITNANLELPFRNPQNHYRGRFHRIVTVGSPQNGTRILYFMRAISAANDAFRTDKARSLPISTVALMLRLDVAQFKFDPFDQQFRDINSPSTNSRWRTDPGASFHIVRTLVNNGNPPSASSFSPADLALGLADDAVGTAVIPRGSDGVVDFDSMGCHGPNGTAAPNVHTYLGANIAHAAAGMFGGESEQTSSTGVALHVISALDFTSSGNPSFRFGPFPLPPLLPNSEKQAIDAAAASAKFNFSAVTQRILPSSSGIQRTPKPNAGSFSAIPVSLTPAPGFPVSGNVQWLVEWYDDCGVTPGEILVVPNSGDPLQAEVMLPQPFVGNAVLYASYRATDGTTVLAPPTLVGTGQPAGDAFVSVSVFPDGIALPIGARRPVEVWSSYASGRLLREFVPAGNFTAVSSDPAVLDVSDPLAWHAVSPGRVTVSGQFQELPYSVELSVFGPSTGPGTLTLTAVPGSPFLELAWPSIYPGWKLETSQNLVNWETMTEPVLRAPGFNSLLLPLPTSGAQFYRLKKDVP
jgi:hypothetical protein